MSNSTEEFKSNTFSKLLFFNILSYAGVAVVAFIFYLFGKSWFYDSRKRKGVGWELFKRFFKGDEKEQAAREIRKS